MRTAAFSRRILSYYRPVVHPNTNRSFPRRFPISYRQGATFASPLKFSDTRRITTMSSAAEEQPAQQPEAVTATAAAAAAAAAADAQPVPAKEEAVQPELPPLSPAEFRVYNQMAEKMDYFHNHFRAQWTILHDAATSGRRPRNMTLKQFIDTGLQFAQHLTAHHGIEERFVFPMLAKRMPEFRGGRGGELLQQHRRIHDGLDGFEDYLRRCRARETELELAVLREKMDSWGGVLWEHLDQEVKTLGAGNMRRYWSMEEVRSMPM